MFYHFNPNLKFSLAEWIRIQRQQIMYLVVGPGDLFGRRLEDWANIRIDAEFQKGVEQIVQDYVENGVLPPDVIAPTILNLADDLVSGRDMVIRAGDYIALRSFMRPERGKKS